MNPSQERSATRQRRRPLRRAVSAMALAGACSVLLAVPALAAGSDDPDALAATSPCAATALGTAPVNPFNGTSPCASGPTSVQEKYEAGAAGAGILIFGASAFVYRRRRDQDGSPRAPRPRQA